MATSTVTPNASQQQASDNFDRQFFSYVVDASVTGSSTLQTQFQILSDADFEWWWILASRTDNRLKVLMSEQATNRQFFAASSQNSSTAFAGINIDLLCGTAQGGAPFPLAVPYIMPSTRVYQLTFTDSSGSTNTVEMVFNGFKLWPTQAAS